MWVMSEKCRFCHYLYPQLSTNYGNVMWYNIYKLNKCKNVLTEGLKGTETNKYKEKIICTASCLSENSISTFLVCYCTQYNKVAFIYFSYKIRNSEFEVIMHLNQTWYAHLGLKYLLLSIT